MYTRDESQKTLNYISPYWLTGDAKTRQQQKKQKIKTTVSKTHGKTFKIYHPYALSGDVKTRQQQEKAKIETTI